MLLRIFAVMGYTTCSGCNASADRARFYTCCAGYSTERKNNVHAAARLQMMAILGCIVITVIAIIIVVIVNQTSR
jgi:hypothetical protein